MAVKVISYKPVAAKQINCSKCTYRLEYTGEDVKSQSYSSYGESDTYYYIACPRCKERVHVRAWR
jgi:hypothetical protein